MSPSKQYVEEKILRDVGWKIHSKDGGRKFWQSPHDGKVYSTSMAVMAEQVHQAEALEAARLKNQQDAIQSAEEYEKFFNFDVNIDEEYPAPKPAPKGKKPVKKTKRAINAQRKKALRELGF